MNKILVIHPDDRSTDFLRAIYRKLKNITLITGGYSKSEVLKMISEHDQVMMMGHGSPWGLFSVGQFTDVDNGYIVDHSMIYLFTNQRNNIYIWCNADKFVDRYKLQGLYSGMFVSETGEALMCNLPPVSQSIVDESNNSFATWLGDIISEKPLHETYEYMMYYYKILAESNSVAEYNSERLYLSEGGVIRSNKSTKYIT